eukprot:CAMPEP_0119481584 /NCGR_PEP_ID=MMETSP1344-20130328/9854_1 /TAXON_ID=236787 /ORGANISM="Florenciella parvula, Strain CCMP2471" /LENGTH=112 /DNA_ID=CAMNT_0007515961 /DNA_START=498 /DNA_END=837 /DNA_ORIENTATION=+
MMAASASSLDTRGAVEAHLLGGGKSADDGRHEHSGQNDDDGVVGLALAADLPALLVVGHALKPSDESRRPEREPSPSSSSPDMRVASPRRGRSALALRTGANVVSPPVRGDT